MLQWVSQRSEKHSQQLLKNGTDGQENIGTEWTWQREETTLDCDMARSPYLPPHVAGLHMQLRPEPQSQHNLPHSLKPRDKLPSRTKANLHCVLLGVPLATSCTTTRVTLKSGRALGQVCLGHRHLEDLKTFHLHHCRARTESRIPSLLLVTVPHPHVHGPAWAVAPTSTHHPSLSLHAVRLCSHWPSQSALALGCREVLSPNCAAPEHKVSNKPSRTMKSECNFMC